MNDLPQPPPTRPKKIFSYLLMVGFTYGLLEALAFLIFWHIEGQPFSFARVRAEQRAIAQLSESENEIRIGRILKQASFANPDDSDRPNWKHIQESSSQLMIRPRDPASDTRTSLRVPIPAGRLWFGAQARLKPISKSNVFVSLAVVQSSSDRQVFHTKRLRPGESLQIDKILDIDTEGSELELSVWFDEEYLGAKGASLIFTELSVSTGVEQALQKKSAKKLDRGHAFVVKSAVHPYAGFTLKPGSSAGHKDDIKANEFGLFSEQSPVYQRGENEVVIMLFGGSVAEILGRIGSDTLVEELAASDALRGKKVVVINAGLRFHKQPQQLMLLNFLLVLGAEIDIVINFDGYNEMKFNIAGGKHWGRHRVANPIVFPGQWSRMIGGLEDPSYVRRVGAAVYLEEERRSWNRWFVEKGTAFSVTTQLIWKLVDQRKAVAIAEALQEVGEPSGMSERLRVPFPSMTYKDGGARVAAHADLWERSSLQMSRIAHAYGIRYFHFLQPNQYVSGSKKMGAPERRAAYRERSSAKRSIEEGYPVLRDAGKRLVASGVSFHDLSMVFRDVEEALYVDTCCHFNQRGNDIVAAEMARIIRPALEGHSLSES